MTNAPESVGTPDITPVTCYGPWLHCPDPNAWMLQLTPVAIAVVCALIARRWIELPLVALVAVLGSFGATQLEVTIAYGTPELPGPMHYGEYAQQMTLVYAILLAIAAVAHGVKRAVQAVSANRTH